MRGWGIGLLVVGALVALGSLLMDTTVYTPGVPAIGGFGGIAGGRTHNLGQLQAQELLFIGGCALFLAGAVFAGAGQIETAIRAPSSRAASLGHAAAGDIGVPVEQLSAEDRDGVVRWVVGVAVLFAVLVGVVAMLGGRGSADQAAVDANAAAMANALDAEADRLDNLLAEPTR